MIIGFLINALFVGAAILVTVSLADSAVKWCRHYRALRKQLRDIRGE